MSQLFNYLKQPDEADFIMQNALPSRLIIALGVTFIVFLINLYFPDPLHEKILYSVCFGLITLGTALLNDLLLPLIFPNYYTEYDWTVGKNVLHTTWTCISITIPNFFFMNYIGLAEMSIVGFGSVFFMTIAVGAVPIMIFVLWKHNRKLKQRLSEVSDLQQKIQQHNALPSTPSSQSISIPSNQKEIKLIVDSFVFAGSERNYIHLVLDEGNQLTVRNTIKNLDDLLRPFPHIVRCHRAYIVNTQKVTDISGNAQGYQLRMNDSKITVPVSRSYIPRIKALLESASEKNNLLV